MQPLSKSTLNSLLISLPQSLSWSKQVYPSHLKELLFILSAQNQPSESTQCSDNRREPTHTIALNCNKYSLDN